MLPQSESNHDQKLTQAVLEESKAEKDAARDGLRKNSIEDEEISPTSPTLIAWSSQGYTRIDVAEFETKQKFANFDGARVHNSKLGCEDCWTHLKEIAGSNLLASLCHCRYKSANLEVFDLSRKGQAKKIYSYEEVSGVTGYGDVAYNPRRSILGAIPVGGKIAYQLFNFASSKVGNTVNLIRKSRWNSQYDPQEKQYITSFDFNLNGEAIATISRNAICMVSDVNTDNCRIHMNMEIEFEGDCWSRCRWITNPGEPLIYVKYDWKQLNILDVEKKTPSLKSPILLPGMWTHCIDVCPNNGNLVASAGTDRSVEISDKRVGGRAQVLEDIQKDVINCVRWSPSGDMIASASSDTTVAFWDFKAGKELYTGNTSDGSPAMSVCFI